MSSKIWKGQAKKDPKMTAVMSCGVLLLKKLPKGGLQFLLMQHGKLWDLPKGHREVGEDEVTAALRETEEETGISRTQFSLIPKFRFESVYYPKYSRLNQTVEKTLVMFLGLLTEEVQISVTEHIGFRWLPWKPPHRIQKNTIDPLLEYLEDFMKDNPM